MKHYTLVLLIVLFVCANLQGQLRRGKFLHLKANGWTHQDTTSEQLLKKYKDTPNLFVTVTEKYELENLEIFNTVPELRRLNIYSKSLESLSGIESLTNLEILNISNNKVKDFLPILALKQLRSLSLNSTVDIDFPLNFTQLTGLNYYCNFDLSQSQFPNLKYLTINQAVEKDSHYDDLENYGIDYKIKEPCCPIHLDKMDSLQVLKLFGLEIKSLNKISFPENLENLHINDCINLENIDVIVNISSLKKLTVRFCNNIQDFSFLKKLKNVEWNIKYMGRNYSNDDLDQILKHPKDLYYYADEKDVNYDGTSFYNFHESVVKNAKVIFAKYHQKIISEDLSRKQFLDLIVPLINELNELCSPETCNIDWNDEESDYLINFLIDMSQLKGYHFDEGHLYRRYEESF